MRTADPVQHDESLQREPESNLRLLHRQNLFREARPQDRPISNDDVKSEGGGDSQPQAALSGGRPARFGYLFFIQFNKSFTN